MSLRAPKTVTNLLDAVKRKLFWDSDVDGNARYTDAELTAIAQELVEGRIYPVITMAKEHCLTAIQDVALTSPTGVDKIPSYSVPIEAMAKIESVSYVDAAGSETPLEEYREREWLKFERSPTAGTGPWGYAFRGARLHLYPHPTQVTGKYVRIRYVARPMTMTSDSTVIYPRVVQDPALNGIYTRFYVDTDPSAWVPGFSLQVDVSVLSAAAPHVPLEVYDTINVTANTTASTLEILTSELWPNSTGGVPTITKKGDFLVPDYTTPIVQLPVEGFNLLKCGVAAEVAGSSGDKDLADRFMREFETGLERLPSVLAPRAVAQPNTWVNNSSPGRMRSRWRWR